MSVRINLGTWGSVFAVPSCIVDEHIRLAGSQQIKVILFLLRNSGKTYTYKEIGDALRIHEEDVKDCVSFWKERGVLCEVDGDLTPASNVAEMPVESAENKEKLNTPKQTVTRLQKPDIITAAQRVSADENLQHMLPMVETALAKPLSSGDTATLVMLYDTCGLPAEVIVMMVNYCVSVGKGNMRAIERLGVKWSDEGINSIEAADMRIAQIKRSSMNWSRVSSVFGMSSVGSPTAKQLEYSDKWIAQWKFSDDMLRRAYETCVDSTGKVSLAYINKIMQRWHDAGIADPEDISKLDVKKNTPKKKTEQASYDIDELEKID